MRIILVSSSNGEAECVKTKTGIFSQSYIFTEFSTISKLQLSAKKNAHRRQIGQHLQVLEIHLRKMHVTHLFQFHIYIQWNFLFEVVIV